MKEYKKQKRHSRTLDSNHKLPRQTYSREIYKCNQSSIQTYRESPTASVSDFQALRDFAEVGYNISKCKKNFAFNKDDKSIWAKSQKNSHSEPKVIMRSNPNSTNDINIVTERAPCDYCKADMQSAEHDRGLHEINVEYLVPYNDQSQNALFHLYNP